MAEREPQLWFGDSHTLDLPTGNEIQEVFGTPNAKDEEISSPTAGTL